MLCKSCNTDMYIDRTEQDGDKEVFFYKCRNPNCTNFGYSEDKSVKVAEGGFDLSGKPKSNV